MKLSLFIFSILFSFICHSQNINWIDYVTNSGRHLNIFNCFENKIEFTTFPTSTIEKPRIVKFEGSTKISEQKMDYKTSEGISMLRKTISFNGKNLCFFTREKSGNDFVFYYLLDENHNVIGEEVLISKIEHSVWNAKNASFKIVLSPNKKFILIEHMMTSKMNSHFNINYSILNMNLEVVENGSFINEHKVYSSVFTDDFISDYGQYYIGIKYFEYGKLIKGKDYDYGHKEYEIYKVSKSELIKIELPLNNEKIINIQFHSTDFNKITCVGLYRKDNKFCNGVINFSINTTSNEVTNSSVKDFNEDFILSKISFNQYIKRYNLRNPRYKVADLLTAVYTNYVFKRFQISNGDYIIIGENVVDAYSSNPNAELHTSCHNEIIIMKFDKNDNLINYKIFEKNQNTRFINEGSHVDKILEYQNYYSSYFCYSDDNKLNIYFNNNLEASNRENNLINQSNFVDVVLLEERMLSKKKCISKIEVNIEDFSWIMKTENFINSTKDLIIPSNCDFSTDSKLVFFHIRSSKKDKFGLLDL